MCCATKQISWGEVRWLGEEPLGSPSCSPADETWRLIHVQLIHQFVRLRHLLCCTLPWFVWWFDLGHWFVWVIWSWPLICIYEWLDLSHWSATVAHDRRSPGVMGSYRPPNHECSSFLMLIISLCICVVLCLPFLSVWVYHEVLRYSPLLAVQLYWWRCS